MLLNLKIENYALIKELDIKFDTGMTAITGETGAGKSIMLGALALILGQRADVAVLLDKEKKCVVEGEFDISALQLETFFKENDLDYEQHTVLRREIIPSGKSRAFVNDTPVGLDILKQLSEKLIDIHSQHKTLTIGESSFQMDVVNTFIKTPQNIVDYQSQFIEYKKLRNDLEIARNKEVQLKAEADYVQFLFDELEQSNLEENEEEKITQELELLNNAELIKNNLFQSKSVIDESEVSVLLQLGEVKNLLTKISDLHPQFKEILNRCEEVYIDLKDISSELTQLESNVFVDPEKQELYNQRLDLIHKLQHKHNVNTVEDLLQIKNNLEQKLEAIISGEEKIIELEKQLSSIEKNLTELSQKLHIERVEAAKQIQTLILPILKELGMPDASLRIVIEENDIFNEFGKDTVKFLFNANLGGELKELSKVASGGEMSRLMMALKSIITTKNILPTIIFDEIDSGISGDIAGKAANVMQKMASTMQVVTITHLPQVAAKAHNQYKVYKVKDALTTYSAIKKLTNEERIDEVAQMLSGEKISQSAVDTAKILLGFN